MEIGTKLTAKKELYPFLDSLQIYFAEARNIIFTIIGKSENGVQVSISVSDQCIFVSNLEISKFFNIC